MMTGRPRTRASYTAVLRRCHMLSALLESGHGLGSLIDMRSPVATSPAPPLPTDKTSDEWRQQLGFYADRAAQYAVEGWGAAEHDWPLAILLGYMSIAKPASVLDVGAGSGRSLHVMRQRFPELSICGIEPSAEFRAIGHRELSLTDDELRDGDATRLPFPDKSFDLVT